MKKKILVTILVMLFSLVAVGSVAAKNDKVNLKGSVLEIGIDTLTVATTTGETVIVTVPAEINIGEIQSGDIVLIKAHTTEDGSLVADVVKLTDDDDDEEESTEGEQPEVDGEQQGGKENGAYCSDEKQDKEHPFAVKLAEKYGVTVEYVMGYFCDGYGMGAIMLALKTSQVEGIDADADTLLAERGAGKGWGNIWKDHGVIGAEKNGKAPPGLLNKPEKDKENNGNNGNGNGNGNKK